MDLDLNRLEVIYDAGKTVVYRGERDDEGRPVILKALRHDFPSRAALAELRHEHRMLEALAQVGTPGVIQSHGLLDVRGRLVLATSDLGADSLRVAMKRGNWNRDAFLAVAISVADVLAAVHDAGVIHKDVNPGNLLWLEDGTVRLLDFGISVRASRDQAQAESLSGTLPYISPEQTGRMNRFVDWRTDLYSVGATFYELLTGRPPFRSDSPMELVHAHIAISPEPPSVVDPTVPEIISHIVTCLLAKNPEDRYQSARGLKADLLEAQRHLDSAGRCEPFELRTHDVNPRFSGADALYGREAEVAWLLDHFEKAARGETQVVLVRGYSGVGKTALINEVQRPIVERRGAFLRGKFDQFHRGLPYASLSEAFDRFILQLLSRSDGERRIWKERIVQATAPNTRLLVDVIPHLGLLVGEQPNLSDLPEAEAENRFGVAFGRLVGALATEAHPLVLFLDDIQWADLPSLRILERLATDIRSCHLLVVGAYRDNEVGAAHPLTGLLARLAESGHAPDVWTLHPLSPEHVLDLVAGVHKAEPDQVRPLAELCFEKTSGNPFFLNQFLADLHGQGLIHFDARSNRWAWDLDGIRARDFTDNVVEFMAARVGELPAAALEVLSVGSVLGNNVEVDLLADTMARSAGELVAPLEAALTSGLVFLESGESPRVTFLHDRVQQAAYESMDATRRTEVHRRVGHILADRHDAGATDVLFDAVTHLTRAFDDLGGEPAYRRLARLAVEAAAAARASAAFGPADEFSATAERALTRAPGDPQLELAAHVQRAHAAFLGGKYEEMDRAIDAVLQAETDTLVKVEMLEVRGQAFNARNELMESIKASLQGLALLGVHIPAQPSKVTVLAELMKAKLRLRGKDDSTLAHLPPCEDEGQKAAMRLLMNLVGPAYYASPDLIPLLAFNTLRLSLEHGVAAESATGFAVYGLVLCTLGELKPAYRYGQICEAIANRFPRERHSARARHLYNTHVRFWVEPWDRSAASLQHTHEAAYANGDFEYAAFSAFMRMALLGSRGADLGELLPAMRRTARALEEMQQETSGWTLALVHQAALNLRGEGQAEPWQLIGEAYDETTAVQTHTEADDTTNLFCYYVERQRLAYLFRRFDLSFEAALKAAPLQGAAASTFFIVETTFYEGMARAAVHPTLGRVEAVRNRWALAQLEKKLTKYADVSQVNAGPCLILLRAERERLAGRHGAALLGYEDAARLAAEHGWHNLEGLAMELAGRLQLSRSNARSAATYLKGARYAYERWGALALVERLVQEFPAAAERTVHSDSPMTTTSSHETIDLDAAMRAARSISEQIVISDLLQSVLDIMIKAAGAQRGALLLREGETPNLAASVNVDESSPYSEAIVRLVLSTHEAVVLDDVQGSGDFTEDPHVLTTRPLSVLCAPLAHAGRDRGVIYLENSLTRGAFTQDRIQLLQLFAAQAAVSLENAQLVQNLEEKVRERTHQLELRNEFIRKTFGRYVSDDVVHRLLDQPEGTTLGGELRRVTVMMADLRGFSTAVRHLPPQMVLQVINNFLEVQTEVVMAHGGTIDEVLGDAMLVLFGAPVSAADDVQRSVRCAIAMQAAMDRVNAANAAAGLPKLGMGIGIHSGEAVVGNIGTEQRTKYGVVGNVVNLAARIESLTTGGQVLISGAVHDALEGSVRTRNVRTFEPKGAPAPLQVYELEGLGDASLAALEAELKPVSPIRVTVAEVSDVHTGPRQEAYVVAVSPEQCALQGIEPHPDQDLRLQIPSVPDARIYGKVANKSDGRVLVTFTAVSDEVLEHLASLPPAEQAPPATG